MSIEQGSSELQQQSDEKQCFVIMPISDPEGYQTGHFRLVYDYIIKPACDMAGYSPIRADDVGQTNYIMIDVLQKIIKSDMVLCDLSGLNPNVLYELGIRQAFNLPVTLMKDMKTERIFDIQGLRTIEYDEKLRIDIAHNDIKKISETLKKTSSPLPGDVNSLIEILGITEAKSPHPIELSDRDSLIMNVLGSIADRITSLEKKTPTPIYVEYPPSSLNSFLSLGVRSPSQKVTLREGHHVRHPKWGEGIILGMSGDDEDRLATIDFPVIGQKTVMLKYAPIEKIG